jgi:hypothetical protein
MRLRIIAILSLASLLSVTVYADDSRAGLFHCGLKLGGFTKSHIKNAVDTRAKKKHFNALAKAMDKSWQDSVPGLRAHGEKGFKPVGDHRTPPALTVANFVCTW